MADIPRITLSRRALHRLLAGSVAATAAPALLGTAAAAAVPATTRPGPATGGAPAGPAGRVDPAAGSPAVEALIRAMTLEEKVALLHGATDPAPLGQAGYLPGVPRLGIPEIRLADGPAGVRVTRHATALPAPVALAATFSTDLAERFGQVIGREGRALGMDVLLSPMTNIVRVPQAGRNFETLGEDPLLAGAVVAAEIRGIQAEGLIATVKHYAANNFERDRQTISADVDERTLREVYLAVFEAAVDAGAGAVMAAYNQVNGVFSTEHPHLLTEVLRGDWGFPGWVMSDWFAAHSAVPALVAGLDMEMPSGNNFAALVPAVRAGELSGTTVDNAVRRILRQLDRFGLLDGVPPRPAIDARAHARVAREVALAGAVLLRNARDILPLDRADLRDVAVIGPTAGSPLIGGGGSARVVPERAEAPLAALVRRAGPGARIRYAAGIDLAGVAVPAGALSLERSRDGGAAEPDDAIDYTGDNTLPAGTSWRWTGTITAPQAGDYDLRVQGAGGVQAFGGFASLAIDGTVIASAGALFGGNSRLIETADGLTNAGGIVHFEAGRPRAIEVRATAGAGTPLRLRLAWVTPARRQEALDEAVRLARAARTTLVWAYNEGTEGQDRPGLALPDRQDGLLGAVTAANPRTVVVLNTGDPVLMPWLDRTAAVLQMWYPGQEGADATAALLLGEADPAGKLPETFPAREQDAPTAPAERYPGVAGHAVYSEGIFVGYRHYDAAGIAPLFPFGHGLSYTRFRYTDLAVRRGRAGGLEVSFLLRNAGRRAGTEVAQVYLGAPERAPVPMARRALGGFARVSLRPGERRRVRISIPERALAYWSIEQDDWVVPAGRRAVLVGSSSRDIRLRGEVEVR